MPRPCTRRNNTECGGSGHSLWLACLSLMSLAGCGLLQSNPGTPPLDYARLNALYQQTELRSSDTLSVLRAMKAEPRDHETITQRDTVVASSGAIAGETRRWFTLFTFDRRDNTVLRKCFFYMEENASLRPIPPRRPLVPRRSILVFEAETLIDEVLRSPATDGLDKRQIVLHYLADRLRHDLKHMSDNRLLVSGFAMNQVFRDALLALEARPNLIHQLGTQDGLAFQPTSLKDGRIWISLQSNVAFTRVTVGMP